MPIPPGMENPTDDIVLDTFTHLYFRGFIWAIIDAHIRVFDPEMLKSLHVVEIFGKNRVNMSRCIEGKHWSIKFIPH